MDERSHEGSTHEDESRETEDGVTERELGEATIVYEHPDDGRVETQVENDAIAYFQDHWIVRTGRTDAGHDTVRRIPSHRVYYVERDVEEFKQEVQSLRNQVESLANDVKAKLSSGGDRDRSGERDPNENLDRW